MTGCLAAPPLVSLVIMGEPGGSSRSTGMQTNFFALEIRLYSPLFARIALLIK
jgi:hypothetical protein